MPAWSSLLQLHLCIQLLRCHVHCTVLGDDTRVCGMGAFGTRVWNFFGDQSFERGLFEPIAITSMDL